MWTDLLLSLVIILELVIYRKVAKKMAELDTKLDALEAEVAEDLTVDQSAVTLITGLSQLLKDALANGSTAEQVARVQAIVDKLDAQNKALADAVAANTPAETP